MKEAAYLRIREVESWLGISRWTLWRMWKIGEFPRPGRLGNRTIGFKVAEVEKWMQKRESARDAA